MTSYNISLLPWGQESEGQVQEAWSEQIERANRATNTKLNQVDTEDKQTEITKTHWKTGAACFNKTCKKKFNLLERIHHCRRCGGSFCQSCVVYKRRLNKLANPDPAGPLYKVCQLCYEEGKDIDGVEHNLTAQFIHFRKQHQETLVLQGNGLKTATWRSRLDIEKECNRLIDGFLASIGNSEIKRTLHEMKNVLSTPEWQKSQFWLMESLANSCFSCKEKFSLIKKKLHCKVCSKCVCKSCSTKDLLIYIADDERTADSTVRPKLAIIKVIGSPSKEPDVALYLRVCKDCQELIVNRQINGVNDNVIESTTSLDRLTTLHNGVQALIDKLCSQLAEYQSIVESLEDDSRYNKDSSKSNMKTLAKSQEDVADFLSQFVLKIQVLKKMKPETNKQAVLFKNCLKSKCDVYFDNLYRFRSVYRKLQETVPPETLDIIQRTVDKHAIISTQLYVRQLVYEAIHLCSKHSLKEAIPQLLTPLDEIVESEAEKCLVKEGEDWDQHNQDIMVMIQSQMKDHRLVRPSRQQLKQEGDSHVSYILERRCSETLQQVHVQLNMKSANRSFQKTKYALEEAHKTVSLSSKSLSNGKT